MRKAAPLWQATIKGTPETVILALLPTKYELVSNILTKISKICRDNGKITKKKLNLSYFCILFRTVEISPIVYSSDMATKKVSYPPCCEHWKHIVD